MGLFDSITNVFAKLPLPRIEKSKYRFLFENIKENVELILNEENNIQALYLIAYADRKNNNSALITFVSNYPSSQGLWQRMICIKKDSSPPILCFAVWFI